MSFSEIGYYKPVCVNAFKIEFADYVGAIYLYMCLPVIWALSICDTQRLGRILQSDV